MIGLAFLLVLGALALTAALLKAWQTLDRITDQSKW
jgi:hypothetical protein